MVVRTSRVPGQVSEHNHYQLLWREGRAAARSGQPRDPKYRGLERRVWLEGYDNYTQERENVRR